LHYPGDLKIIFKSLIIVQICKIVFIMESNDIYVYYQKLDRKNTSSGSGSASNSISISASSPLLRLLSQKVSDLAGEFGSEATSMNKKTF
jgi:hypothetical protein